MILFRSRNPLICNLCWYLYCDELLICHHHLPEPEVHISQVFKDSFGCMNLFFDQLTYLRNISSKDRLKWLRSRDVVIRQCVWVVFQVRVPDWWVKLKMWSYECRINYSSYIIIPAAEDAFHQSESSVGFWCCGANLLVPRTIRGDWNP